MRLDRTVYTELKHDPVYELIKKLSIDIKSFGCLSQEKISSLGSFVVPDYEFVFIKQGEVKIETERVSKICHSSDLILYKPFRNYSVECISGFPLVYYYCHFNIDPICEQKAFEQELGKDDDFLVFEKERFPFAENIFEDGAKDFRRNRKHLKSIFYSSLLALITQLMQSNACLDEAAINEDFSQPNNSMRIVDNGIHYICSHLYTPIRASDVADHLGISQNYLYKIFKKSLNVSPSNYILSLKMREAARLVSKNSHSVTKVSEMLAFSSPSYFCKVFTNFYGISPQKYRL